MGSSTLHSSTLRHHFIALILVPRNPILQNKMAKFAVALLSVALLAASVMSQDDVTASCSAQCGLSCDVSLSQCVDLPPFNNCAKDKEVCVDECMLTCVCDENCLKKCVAAQTACEAAGEGLINTFTCKTKAAVCEGSCPASCAVSTGAEAVKDLGKLVPGNRK